MNPNTHEQLNIIMYESIYIQRIVQFLAYKIFGCYNISAMKSFILKWSQTREGKMG